MDRCSEASLNAREDNVNDDEYCYNKRFGEHVTDYHWPDDGAWCGQGMLVDSDVFITLVLVTWRGCGSRSGLMCRIMGMCLCLRLCDGLGCDKLPAHMALKQSHHRLTPGFTPLLSPPPRLGHYDGGSRSPQTSLIPISSPSLSSSLLPLFIPSLPPSLRHVLSLNHSVSHLPLPPGDITAHSLLRVWSEDVHRTTAAWFKILFLFASSGRPLWHCCSENDRPKGAFQWRVH